MGTRSIWKGPFISHSFFQEVLVSNKNILKTSSRNVVILPFLMGKSILVHNGKIFISIFVIDFEYKIK